MNLGHRHQSLRRRVLQPKNLKSTPLIKSVDSLVYIVSILSLLFTLDQVRIVWIENNASGVSLLSWIFYAISSLVWLFYGILHKEKIVTITNLLWVVFSLFVVVGILSH